MNNSQMTWNPAATTTLESDHGQAEKWRGLVLYVSSV